jgi:multimeric flavodoxin WrbA
MKVLGIATSPRRGANSQTLVEHILAGAKEAGASTEMVRLCAMDIRPCTGCNQCRGGDGCVIDDEMNVLIEKLEMADAVVLGSPIYWGRLNAQAYPFIDRLYALIKPDFTTDFPKGKKIAVALTCGGMEPEAIKPVNDYLKFVFGFLGFADGGFICQNHCLLADDIAKFPATIREAEDLGRNLVK